MRQFKKVAVGGTFDELHRGHKTLLLKAFEVGDHVVIGLSSDALVRQMNKPHVTAAYDERLENLEVFLRDSELLGRAEVVALDDAYGTSISDPYLEALVVSEETRRTALKINELRLKAELSPLAIITVSMVPSQNCTPISTTRIRKGEMDKEGRLLKI
ncbi:MAG: pantetheine-phosphate adenylyltransferase [Candidatus Bathyarchaeota archaeon]|nr:pantetheine-phosphate adenylyltransferase [Candidatus Bathyarchaeota archaeon]